jgi:adenylate cyclase class 2
MQSAEIELKFRVPDTAALQSRLPALGFLLETPRTFESNTLYDTVDRILRESGQILRVRQYGERWTVTHKRHPDDEDPGHVDTRYKVRIETETTVADGPALAEIFKRLGYGPMFRYEKYRTEWSHPAGQGACHLVVDETPIGTFAELEGPIDWIDRTIAQLGIDPDACLTDSYGKLFLTWKSQTGSAVENLTFDEIPALTSVAG